MPSSLLPNTSLALVALALSLAIRSDAPLLSAPLSCLSARMSALPRVTLWAWERREDLRSLDARKYAVAYLDQTLTIGLNVTRQPRRDPVVFPSRATRMPVVRIEAPRQAVLDETNRTSTLAAILSAAREPNIAALQLDYDATRRSHWQAPLHLC
jgi:hypothetical protein